MEWKKVREFAEKAYKIGVRGGADDEEIAEALGISEDDAFDVGQELFKVEDDIERPFDVCGVRVSGDDLMALSQFAADETGNSEGVIDIVDDPDLLDDTFVETLKERGIPAEGGIYYIELRNVKKRPAWAWSRNEADLYGELSSHLDHFFGSARAVYDALKHIHRGY